MEMARSGIDDSETARALQIGNLCYELRSARLAHAIFLALTCRYLISFLYLLKILQRNHAGAGTDELHSP